MKVKSLIIKEHYLFKSTKVNLATDSEDGSNIKTVIIGPNGTGKSSILGIIAEAIINETSKNKRKLVSKIPYSYELEICSNEASCITSDPLMKLEFKMGKILAVSSNVNDRFPYRVSNKNTDKRIYEYLGVRTASNNVFYSNTKDKIVENIKYILADQGRILSLINILKELGKDEVVTVTFSANRYFNHFSDIMSGIIDVKKIQTKEFSSVPYNRFLDSEWLSLYYSDYRDIVSKVTSAAGREISFTINLRDEESIASFLQSYSLLKLLVEVKVIAVNDVSLFTLNKYGVYNASSGEFNILRTFIAILARVENDSIILIDEPELSLHPNWQVEYISLLDILLNNYRGCHIIIATHSHFILSNIDKHDAKIIGLGGDLSTGCVSVVEYDVNTYGLSPEHVLYKVFGVTGFNNKHFELDLRIIINYMSNKRDEIRRDFLEAVGRVSAFDIDRNEPLHGLIQNAMRHAKEIEGHNE